MRALLFRVRNNYFYGIQQRLYLGGNKHGQARIHYSDQTGP